MRRSWRVERVVDLKNLKFAYHPSHPILSIAEFNIEKQERVFVYGPSGSGKTTFLGLIAGVLRASQGQIRVLGQDYSLLKNAELDRFRGKNIGYIFQTFNLIPYLSVEENVRLTCDLNPERRPVAEGLKESVQSLLERLALMDVKDSLARELSVGQAQRVAAARALLGGPGLIVADEPTSSLDADTRNRFLDLLFSEVERSGSTLIFVSHDRSLEGRFTRSASLLEINPVVKK